MANLKNLEMGKSLLSNKDLCFKRSMMGLFTQCVYQPTGSPIKLVRNDYRLEVGTRLVKMLDQPVDKALLHAPSLKLDKLEVGNVRVEACVSADRQFLAVQVLRYEDFVFKPMCEPHFYTGDEASVMSKVLL